MQDHSVTNEQILLLKDENSPRANVIVIMNTSTRVMKQMSEFMSGPMPFYIERMAAGGTETLVIG
jgi:hypothetical protein